MPAEHAAQIQEKDRRIDELISKQDELIRALMVTAAELKATLMSASADVAEQRQISARERDG